MRIVFLMFLHTSQVYYDVDVAFDCGTPHLRFEP